MQRLAGARLVDFTSLMELFEALGRYGQSFDTALKKSWYLRGSSVFLLALAMCLSKA